MIPFHYAYELIKARIERSTTKIVYVEDDLYESYEAGLVGSGYRAMEVPEPNRLVNNKIIRPMSTEQVCSECGRTL